MTFWDDDIRVEGGPFKVLLAKGELADKNRAGRVIPYKIYYPEGAADHKTPVILWSHGFGGNRDGAGFLSRFVASYGYIIVHMSHRGTDSSLWEGQPGHPWDILRKTKVPREATLARFADIPFVLDHLLKHAGDFPQIGNTMDMDALGISGHSFGAMTTQVMAGQLFPDAEGVLRSYKEPRFRAGILYSPVPIAHITEAPPAELYGPISLPLLHMTGTRDDSPIENFGYEERLIIYEKTQQAERSLLVKMHGDHMVYNGTRGKLAANPLRKRHEEIISVASLAYWDAHLKNSSAAKEWLAGEGLTSYIGQDGTYSYSSS